MPVKTTAYHYVVVGAHGCASAEGLVHYPDGAMRDHTVSCSSYDDLDRFLERHGDEIADGAPVVDLTVLADRDDLVSLAWRAPLVDVRVAGEHIDRSPRADADDLGIVRLLAGSYFGAAGVAAVESPASEDDPPGPFDGVSPWALANYWHGHGARVGAWDAHTRTVKGVQ